LSRIRENFLRVRERIDAAARRVGRSGDDVALCAVTKLVGLPEIREVVDAGAVILGENRVQEAEPKIREVGDLAGRVTWHMIGHLQRNKARRAVELFDEIESVDGLALARRLSDLGEEGGAPVPILVEVRMSDEPAKTGVLPEEAADVVGEIRRLPGVALKGLMAMAPFTDDESRVRSSFSGLRELRDRLGGAVELPELSMGMTADFEIAVEEGSTLVRIGAGLFGRG
jgi:pyridoxal phosphate enzyme (YggS family)